MWNENTVVIIYIKKLKFNKKILFALQWDLTTGKKIRL